MHKHESRMRLQRKIAYENLSHRQNKDQLTVHIITLKSFEVFLGLRTPSNKRLRTQCMSP